MEELGFHGSELPGSWFLLSVLWSLDLIGVVLYPSWWINTTRCCSSLLYSYEGVDTEGESKPNLFGRLVSDFQGQDPIEIGQIYLPVEGSVW